MKLFTNERTFSYDPMEDIVITQRSQRVKFTPGGLEKVGIAPGEEATVAFAVGEDGDEVEGIDISGKVVVFVVDDKNDSHHKGYKVTNKGHIGRMSKVAHLAAGLGVGSTIKHDYVKNENGFATTDESGEYITEAVEIGNNFGLTVEDQLDLDGCVRAYACSLYKQTPPYDDRLRKENGDEEEDDD